MNGPDPSPLPPLRMLGMPIDPQRFPFTTRFLRTSSTTPQDHAEPFAALMRSGEVPTLLLDLLGWAAGDPAGSAIQGEHTPSIVLWRDAERIVSLSAVRPNRLSESGVGASESADFILSPRYFSLLGTLSQEHLTYTRYRLDAPGGLAVFDPHGRIVDPRQERLAPGEALVMMDPGDVIDFSTEMSHQLTLQVILTGFELPLVWTFDRASLQAVRSISASDAATRSELLLDLFGHLKYDGRRDFLDDMRYSAHHFVRWKAVQTLLRIYGTAGLDALRHACNDAHPHVRRAAQTTLQAITATASA